MPTHFIWLLLLVWPRRENNVLSTFFSPDEFVLFHTFLSIKWPRCTKNGQIWFNALFQKEQQIATADNSMNTMKAHHWSFGTLVQKTPFPKLFLCVFLFALPILLTIELFPLRTWSPHLPAFWWFTNKARS